MENNTMDWTIGDHLEDFNNPHEVTKEQVGLGNVENVRQYSELNPPPRYINTVCGKKPDANGDIDLVKGDVNLGKVDNVKQYSEKNPPPYPVTSVNGMTGAVVITGGDEAGLNAHMADKSNPHSVTKAQVGLDKVDNTADLEKPVSAATQAVLDTKLNANDYVPCDCTQVEEDLAQHVGDMGNPHSVTKAQVGLGNVPNVVPYHGENKPTKADVGLGNVDNTADLSKPVSAAMQAALNTKLTLTAGAEPTTDKDIIIDGMIIARKGIYYNIPSRPKAFVTTEDTQYISGDKNFTGALQKNGRDVADVESGTWTPSAKYLTFAGQGRYTRVGNMVTVTYANKVTCNNTSSNEEVYFEGLPYAPKGMINYVGSVGYIGGETFMNPNQRDPAPGISVATSGNQLALLGWAYARSWYANYNGLYWNNCYFDFTVSYEI